MRTQETKKGWAPLAGTVLSLAAFSLPAGCSREKEPPPPPTAEILFPGTEVRSVAAVQSAPLQYVRTQIGISGVVLLEKDASYTEKVKRTFYGGAIGDEVITKEYDVKRPLFIYRITEGDASLELRASKELPKETSRVYGTLQADESNKLFLEVSGAVYPEWRCVKY